MEYRAQSSLQKVAALICARLRHPTSDTVVVQLFIRDKKTKAFGVSKGIENAQQVSLALGQHPKPDITLHMTMRDVEDLAQLGFVRAYVAVTGAENLAQQFRREFMTVPAWGKEAIDAIAPTVPHESSIDRIEVGSISDSEFLERYAAASRPAIIVDAMPRCRQKTWSVERLRSEFKALTVRVRHGDYAKNIYRPTMETKTTSFDSYIDSCVEYARQADCGGVPPYAASNVVPFEWNSWLDFPPYVPNELCSFAKFWIGPPGTATPLHRDWTDNFLSQLHGSKKFALIAPGYAGLLKPQTRHFVLDTCNWIDPFDDNDALASQCHPLITTLDAGEMIFIPAGWFHDVRSTSFSFSVNFFVMRVPYSVCPP
jgi:hypothetical protein